MKIGIYNRYWNTFGGGEKHVGVIAEILSQHFDVDLIGTEPVNLSELCSQLDLSLPNVRYVMWSPLHCGELSSLTKKYDLFINSTYCSPLASMAKKSVYLVFFPHWLVPVVLSPFIDACFSALKRLAAPEIVPLSGFYGKENNGICWGRDESWVRLRASMFDSRSEARIPIWDHRGDLKHRLLSVKGEGICWSLNGEELVIKSTKQPTKAVDLCILTKTFIPVESGYNEDTRHLGIGLNLYGLRRKRYLHVYRHWINRMVSRMPTRSFVSTYDYFIANSQFTRTWLLRRWGKESVVLNPPVETGKFKPPSMNRKKRVILSVGRFFAGGHNKKHIKMLKAFRGMCDRGEIPEGWEYHLVGKVHREREVHVRYFSKVQRLAVGYPVKVLADLRFSDLLNEYHSASIFWHAAGWGESENRHPERCEHFGMSTCEAMSAGCIPVVVAKAGQLEIVHDGKNGFTFTSEKELVQKTKRLIATHDSRTMVKLANSAMDTVKKFSREKFREHVMAFISGII
jgi:glycosyltransferase involved in cell wall biosynthesis